MKTETIHLSQIQVNGANPRTIKNDKFEKLIRSILILPKMLELRPIVGLCPLSLKCLPLK